MDESTVATLLQLAEPLVALSITHLTPATRAKLAADDLSINAYPSDYGGLVYVVHRPTGRRPKRTWRRSSRPPRRPASSGSSSTPMHRSSMGSPLMTMEAMPAERPTANLH